MSSDQGPPEAKGPHLADLLLFMRSATETIPGRSSASQEDTQICIVNILPKDDRCVKKTLSGKLRLLVDLNT